MTTDLTPADIAIIFYASRLYWGVYLGDCLPVHPWQWPRQTWFQERLEKIRKEQGSDD